MAKIPSQDFLNSVTVQIKYGTIRAFDISKKLSADKRDVQKALTELQKRGIAIKIKESPALWSLVPSSDQTEVKQAAGEDVEDVTKKITEVTLSNCNVDPEKAATFSTDKAVTIDSSLTSSSHETIDMILKILEVLANGKEMTAADIAKKTGLGRAAKDVNPLLYHLVKYVLIDKKENSTKPLFSKGKASIEEGNLLMEVSASFDAEKGAQKAIVTNHFHDHHHAHTNIVKIGDNNVDLVVPQNANIEKDKETPAEKQAEAKCME